MPGHVPPLANPRPDLVHQLYQGPRHGTPRPTLRGLLPATDGVEPGHLVTADIGTSKSARAGRLTHPRPHRAARGHVAPRAVTPSRRSPAIMGWLKGSGGKGSEAKAYERLAEPRHANNSRFHDGD